MSPAVTGDAPRHQIRVGAVAAAVTLAVALLAGLALYAARPGALTRAEPIGAPVTVAPASEPGPAPAPASDPVADPDPLDLSAVRVLPPAGAGDDGSEADGAAGPAGLRIPSLDVDDATVVPVGIDAAGGLEIPGAHEVGWYRFGARPGAGAGSIVLAAHVAYDGEDGVFRHLGSLEPGATVVVETADGRQLGYRVDSVAVHPKADLPIDDLFTPNSPERLVLITCGGSFNPQLRHYDSNVVVIATPTPAD